MPFWSHLPRVARALLRRPHAALSRRRSRRARALWERALADATAAAAWLPPLSGGPLTGGGGTDRAAQADDAPPRGCGWFDSSHELHLGLQIVEHAAPDAVAGDLPMALWLDAYVAWRGGTAAPTRAAWV